MDGVTLHGLPGAQGYADAAAWNGTLSQTLKAYIAEPSAQPDQSRDIADLPLIEVPPTGPQTDSLAIFITGDGGWAGIDKDIAGILAENGIGVVGLDSLRYLLDQAHARRRRRRSGPDHASLSGGLEQAAGHPHRLLSGADALPPMAANLPPELRQAVRQVTLLAPSKYVELEFHVSDWMHDDEAGQDIALLPEVRKLEPVPMLCVYGQDEEQSLCMDLRPDEATIKSLPGSHHFNGEYAKVAALILEHLKLP
jgi:Type IV secretory pathway, VirJ component